MLRTLIMGCATEEVPLCEVTTRAGETRSCSPDSVCLGRS